MPSDRVAAGRLPRTGEGTPASSNNTVSRRASQITGTREVRCLPASTKRSLVRDATSAPNRPRPERAETDSRMPVGPVLAAAHSWISGRPERQPAAGFSGSDKAGVWAERAASNAPPSGAERHGRAVARTPRRHDSEYSGGRTAAGRPRQPRPEPLPMLLARLQSSGHASEARATRGRLASRGFEHAPEQVRAYILQPDPPNSASSPIDH